MIKHVVILCVNDEKFCLTEGTLFESTKEDSAICSKLLTKKFAKIEKTCL